MEIQAERNLVERMEPVIIGPPTVGKTTVSKLLAEKMGLPCVSMDDILFSYFKEVGFDEDHWKLIAEKLGRPAAYRYLKVFGSYGVRRILESHKNCVFDFGGGGVTGEFPDEFAAMKSLLGNFKNVVFLIPTPDKKESLQYLYNRLGITPSGWTLLEHFIYHHAHDELANHVIYVKDKSPEQICDEVLGRIKFHRN
ncbi:MAG: shikimate kinase [Pseudobdellovibrionaceae bacterium]